MLQVPFCVFDWTKFKYHGSLSQCQLREVLCNHSAGRNLLLALIVNIACS